MKIRRLEYQAATRKGGKPPEPAQPPEPEQPTEPVQPLDPAVTPQAQEVEPGDVDFTEADLEEIMDPDFLAAITSATTATGEKRRFYYELVDQPPPGVPQHVMGFTNMETGVITLVKPVALHLLKKLGINKGSSPEEAQNGKRALRGFFRHEGGHHAPEVVRLYMKLTKAIGDVSAEPPELEEYFADEKDEGKTRELFWRAVHSDAHNGALDVWLEDLTSRDPFATARNDFRCLYESSVEGRPQELFDSLPLHHQLTQWLVGEERYYRIRETMPLAERRKETMKKAQELLDPEVVSALERLHGKNAIQALRTAKYYTPGAPERYQEGAINEKFHAIQDHIYIEWRKLLVKEFELRVKDFKDTIGEEKWKELEEKENEIQEQNKNLKDQEDKKTGPLQEIRARILKDLLGYTEQLGEGAYSSQAPSDGETRAAEGAYKKVRGQGTGRGKQAAKPQEGKPNPDDKSALDEYRDRMRRASAKRKKGEMGEMADRFGVSEQTIRFVEDVEKEYEQEINDMATALMEIFEDQRKLTWQKHRKEGLEIPHLRPVKVAFARRGIRDTKTHERPRRQPEFMQTEVEMMYDVSGSMGGSKLQMSQIMGIIISRAFEKAKNDLEAKRLLRPKEEDPLRIGHSCFADVPYRIKKLGEPITDKSLAQMVENTNKMSGGTNIETALGALLGEFEKNTERVMKFLVFASDGEGNAAATQALLQEIEKDNDIIVIVLGMGANKGDVINTFSSKARAAGSTNVYPIAENDVRKAARQLMKYITKHLRERAGQLVPTKGKGTPKV
ncbi:MAG: vWA domain-containing protein [Candidatus Kerfeldbacteria bacterium]